jgi:hypothetical protein
VRGLVKRVAASAPAEPLPGSFVFGDGINWKSRLRETFLYVELPFWLMTPPGDMQVAWGGVTFPVRICPPWMEVFGREVTDSRLTVLHYGPLAASPPPAIAELAARHDAMWLRRPGKTFIRLSARAHAGAFRAPAGGQQAAVKRQQQAYWASLCEAHLPVVNELIQRYRLVTYDYFAYEVSAWDVPVWYLTHGGAGYRAVLVPYKSWDEKPVTDQDGAAPGEPGTVSSFEWATLEQLASTSSAEATPGEFDLIDARSLMERGDYTGAVRRTVTAIEAVLAWALLHELQARHPADEAAARLARTDNDFPGRLAQWRRLARPEIADELFSAFETTRKIRHEIVHRSRRLTHQDRGLAQRAVDTSRWLYNQIEDNPERAMLRDKGALKSVGRAVMAPRLPTKLGRNGITVAPL